MSLFGTSSPPSEQARNTSSSLFDTEASTPTSKDAKAQSAGASGLFAESDESTNTNDSPWGNTFTPKKQARSDLIKKLLPNNQVPDPYIDVFDALVEEGYGRGPGVSRDAIGRLLDESNLGAEDRTKISDIFKAGSSDQNTFTRGEINVLLALIGLAKEGEEISLDGVDERKSSEYHVLRVKSSEFPLTRRI